MIKYIEVEKIVEKIIYKPIDEMPQIQEQTAEKNKEKQSDLNSICSIGQEDFDIDALDIEDP